MRIKLKIIGNAPVNNQFRFQTGNIIRSKNSHNAGIVTAANYLSKSEIGLNKVVYEIMDTNGTTWTEYQKDIELL